MVILLYENWQVFAESEASNSLLHSFTCLSQALASDQAWKMMPEKEHINIESFVRCGRNTILQQ